jgi:hypothetical protein
MSKHFDWYLLPDLVYVPWATTLWTSICFRMLAPEEHTTFVVGMDAVIRQP